jgi:hypothetical protein
MTSEPLRPAAPWLAVRGRTGGVPLGAILAGGVAMATAAVGLLHLDRLPLTVCFFKAMTGWACLTCGTTRALGRLFQGDLAGALAQNPLSTLAVFALVPWAIADLVLMPSGRALDVQLGPGAARAARVGAVLALLANWVYLLAVGR